MASTSAGVGVASAVLVAVSVWDTSVAAWDTSVATAPDVSVTTFADDVAILAMPSPVGSISMVASAFAIG